MKTIGIYTNTDKDVGLEGTRRVVEAIGSRAELICERSLGLGGGVKSVDTHRLFESSDAVIALGGDGTILEAARQCAPSRVPLVGINLGRVGYMAELELDELSLLDRLLDGDFRIENRMMLELDLGRVKTFALNDAVLGGDSLFRMVEIELACDSKPVNRYRADGLIISTPTGSTAYNLSAGGAVVDPRMSAMIATPICSHSLNATPIVFCADSVLEMSNHSERNGKLWLSVDGCELYSLGQGESVKITRSPMSAVFARLKDGGFYEVLYRKMSERR